MDGNEPPESARDRQAEVRLPTTVPARWARTLRHDVEMVCEIWDRLPEGAQRRLVDEGFVEPPGTDPDPLDPVEVADPAALAAHADRTDADEGWRYESDPVPPSDSVVVYETADATVAVGAAVDEAFDHHDVDEFVLTTPVGDWETVTDARRALADVFADVDRVTLALAPDEVGTRHLAGLGGLDGVTVGTVVDPEKYPSVGEADYGGRERPDDLGDRARLVGKRVRDLLFDPHGSVAVADVERRTEGPGWEAETEYGGSPPDGLLVGIDDWRIAHVESAPSTDAVDRLIEDHDPTLVRGPAVTGLTDEVIAHQNADPRVGEATEE